MNLGASQSFVLSTFAMISGLGTKLMQQKVFVALPTGETISCARIAMNCPLEIGGVVMEADLILFKLLGFDIILRMDWLFRHYTSINC